MHVNTINYANLELHVVLVVIVMSQSENSYLQKGKSKPAKK